MIQKWESKDGTIRKIDDMDEDHIRNCINLVSRSIGRKTLLKLLMTGIANELKKKNKHRNEVVLQGDMAQQFNDIQEQAELEDEFECDATIIDITS